MALTRKFLNAMGIEADKVDEIILSHAETVDALKEKRDAAEKLAETYKADAEKYKADAEKLAVVQKELDDFKNSQGANVFEKRYNEMKEANEKLQSEFDAYKSQVEADSVKRNKESVYRDLLKKANISEKHLDKIIKVSDIDSIELTEDGKAKNEETLLDSIKNEWGEFAVQQQQQGAPVPTPEHTNVTVPKKESRAAMIAARYHADLYGENPREGNQ